MGIQQNLAELRTTIPAHVSIIVVSKTQEPGKIMDAYKSGQRNFGENKVQEIISKFPLLPSDIKWHFIGHLQTNKVRLIVPFIYMIHSIDSFKLLQEVEKEAGKIDRVIPCLLQLHIAKEESKYGLLPEEAFDILESREYKAMKHIHLRGLMGMATFSEDENLIRAEFRSLREYFIRIKARFFRLDKEFRELSMGMSGDYPIAIGEGSTMVRIGTSVFGQRDE
jgi:pyridoxal phosphate enzyme (YggS family)